MAECVATLVLLVAVGQLAAFALPLRLEAPQRIAVGLGLLWTLPLLAFAVLRPFGAPTAGAARALLGAFGLVAALLCLRRRRASPPGELAWAGSVLAVAAAVAAAVQLRFAFSYQDSALLYLSYGGYVLHPGSDYPLLESYGHRYAYPFMQMKYALVAATWLLSSGDRLAFYLHGVPLLSATFTTAVIYGAVLFLRDHLSKAGSVLMAAVLLYVALNDKLFSVRAETMAWMAGFAFLIVLGQALRPGAGPRAVVWFVAAVLFVTTAMLHGVVLVAATCLGLGVGLHTLGRRRGETRRLLAGAALAAALAALLLGGLYAALHAPFFLGDVHGDAQGGAGAFLDIHDEPPQAGDIDPGIAFYHLYTRTPPVPGWVRVGDGPPVVSLARHLELLLLDPLLGPLPAPRPVQLGVLGLGVAAGLAWGWARWRRRGAPPLPGALLTGLLVLAAALLGYSIYLDYISRAWFPWGVGVRRLLPYIQASFCAVFVLLPFAWLESRSRGPRAQRVVALLAVASALGLAWGITRHATAGSRAHTAYLAPSFLEAVRWLRGSGEVGVRAVANFGSMGHMLYLTGTPFVSEGVMPYELHGLMRRNAETLLRTRELVLEPSAARVRDYASRLEVRFVLLSTGVETPGFPTFKLPGAALPEDYESAEVVFRNEEYVILRLRDPEVP